MSEAPDFELSKTPAAIDPAVIGRTRYSEDYRDAYAAHIMMMDEFFLDRINTEEFKKIFLEIISTPIRKFEEHIRTLRQRNVPDKDLSTAEIKLRDGEEERATQIDAEVAKCEELRLAFFGLYQDPSAPKNDLDEVGKNFQAGLENLETVFSRIERDDPDRPQSY